jgi:hypothetical protein
MTYSQDLPHQLDASNCIASVTIPKDTGRQFGNSSRMSNAPKPFLGELEDRVELYRRAAAQERDADYAGKLRQLANDLERLLQSQGRTQPSI